MDLLETVLKKHGLKKTHFRIELLNHFYQTNSSLTIDEIRKKTRKTNDKVTIYRALNAFKKSGLIHQVPDKNNLIRYALCQTQCQKDGHLHQHAHFICHNCEDTFCLDKVLVPSIEKINGCKIDIYHKIGTNRENQ